MSRFRFLTTPPALLLIIGGMALACWPVFRWWVSRMTDGSDDPLGFVALIAAAAFLWQRRQDLRPSPYGVWLALGLILTQGMLPLPALVRGGFLVTALTLAFALPKRQPGITVLLFLSLPLVASLQYFGGYPLRIVTAVMAGEFLGGLGIDTERVGTMLRWRDHEVGVDAACSGVKLLWVTCFTAAALAARGNLTWGRTLLLLTGALVLVILLNAVRSTLLFFPESGLVVWPEWTHEGIGLGLFVMVAASLSVVAGRWSRAHLRSPLPPALPLPRPLIWAWTAGVLFTSSLAIQHETSRPPAAAADLVEWPRWFEGEKLSPVPLSPAEVRFAAGFPGQINVFQTPTGRTVIFRHVLRPSRQLHSSADCLKAAGYTLHPEPLAKDDLGRSWGSWQADGPGPVRRVRELITDRHGLHFPDPSSWFWPALLGKSNGPWTAITVMD